MAPARAAEGGVARGPGQDVTDQWNWSPDSSAHPPIAQRLKYAPYPAYPDAAKAHRLSGTGRFKIQFDKTGKVANVLILQSTGSKVLDDATTTTLWRWRALAGKVNTLILPVTFTAPQNLPAHR